MAESFKKTVKKVFTNKYVLYIILFLSVTNILGYLAMGNINSVIFFILLAFLTRYFSDNMIIILLTAMIGTSILYITNFSIKVKEGLKNQTVQQDTKQQALNEVKDDEVDDSPKIDRGKTNKIAFQSLQDMLGKEGVNGLQNDTADLIKRQDELKKSMESLAPMMETAQNVLNSIDMNSMGKITNMLDKFNIGGNKKKD